MKSLQSHVLVAGGDAPDVVSQQGTTSAIAPCLRLESYPFLPVRTRPKLTASCIPHVPLRDINAK